MSITHAKVSAKADGGDPTLVLPSDWNAAHVGGLSWRNAWSGATAYGVGDVVSLACRLYACNAAHTNHTPPNASYWDVLGVTVDSSGAILVNGGSWDHPGIHFPNGEGTGIWSTGANILFSVGYYAVASFSSTGVTSFGFGITNATDALAGGLALGDTGAINWQSTYPTKDLGLSRVSAGLLGIGNGTQGDYSGKFTGRYVARTAASDPQHATPGSRPAGVVGEVCYYSGKLYFCTNASTPTWEKVTSG